RARSQRPVPRWWPAAARRRDDRGATPSGRPGSARTTATLPWPQPYPSLRSPCRQRVARGPAWTPSARRRADLLRRQVDFLPVTRRAMVRPDEGDRPLQRPPPLPDRVGVDQARQRNPPPSRLLIGPVQAVVAVQHRRG